MKTITVGIGIMLMCTMMPNSMAYHTLDTNTVVCTNDIHVIMNPTVPYVGQGNDSFCALASTAMQMNYLGFNTTLPEILHDVGYGYLRTYYKFLPGASRLPGGGAGITQMAFSMESLANIYNATFKDFSLIQYEENQSVWDQYYEKVKELINLDMPIQTGVDPYKLSFWQERLNFSNDTTGGHAIVLVGYNEENKSICFNDPYAAALNISGSYIWEDVSNFKKAVEGMNGFYKIYVFYQRNQTKNPSREERFERVHELNIQRLKGTFKYYFGIDIDPSDLPFLLRLFYNNCYHLGIDAAKTQKKDVNGPLQRLFLLSLYKQYEKTIISPSLFYYDVFQQIENVSAYLLAQQHLSSICLYDGNLLQQEAHLWRNLSNYFKEIQKINMNHSLLKTFIKTKILFDDIEGILDDIIALEQEIIGDDVNTDNNIYFLKPHRNICYSMREHI